MDLFKFLRAVHTFNQLDRGLRARAEIIIRKYLNPDSPHSVMIDSECVDEVKQSIENLAEKARRRASSRDIVHHHQRRGSLTHCNTPRNLFKKATVKVEERLDTILQKSFLGSQSHASYVETIQLPAQKMSLAQSQKKTASMVASKADKHKADMDMKQKSI